MLVHFDIMDIHLGRHPYRPYAELHSTVCCVQVPLYLRPLFSEAISESVYLFLFQFSKVLVLRRHSGRGIWSVYGKRYIGRNLASVSILSLFPVLGLSFWHCFRCRGRCHLFTDPATELNHILCCHLLVSSVDVIEILGIRRFLRGGVFVLLRSLASGG